MAKNALKLFLRILKACSENYSQFRPIHPRFKQISFRTVDRNPAEENDGKQEREKVNEKTNVLLK